MVDNINIDKASLDRLSSSTPQDIWGQTYAAL